MSRSRNSHQSEQIHHGPKTQAAIAEQQRRQAAADAQHTKGPREVPDAEIAKEHTEEIEGTVQSGKHRIVEDRVQHDVADHNSDRNRLAADSKKHKHGNPHGRLNGGAISH